MFDAVARPNDDPAVRGRPVLAAVARRQRGHRAAIAHPSRRLRPVRVRRFELRLIGGGLVVAWSVTAIAVLVAYRPGGPLDVLVGVTLLVPIAIAVAGVVWPPLARGSAAFPLMVAVGIGTLLVLLPSIGGVLEQLVALGSQTLMPSPEAAYPWLLALFGTSLFAGFGIARRLQGGTALRRRRLIGGMAFAVAAVLVVGSLFAGVAIANEMAVQQGGGTAGGSRFGPTTGDGEPPDCDAGLGVGLDREAAGPLRRQRRPATDRLGRPERRTARRGHALERVRRERPPARAVRTGPDRRPDVDARPGHRLVRRGRPGGLGQRDDRPPGARRGPDPRLPGDGRGPRHRRPRRGASATLPHLDRRGDVPGQKPRLLTSCEYASRVIASGRCGIPPGCGGAGRPENRVTARSKLPQKKCTGLHLPQNRDRNSLNTRSLCTRTRQNRLAYSRS